jgi:adenylate kinase family enzyme
LSLVEPHHLAGMVNLSAANKARIEASAQYVETHEVYQLFEELLADLLVQKPADPISHLIEALKSSAPPRVIITGPPSSDTRSQCEMISSRIGLVHVYGPDMARESASVGSALGLKAKGVADSSTTGEIPDDLMLDLLKEKLGSEECLSNGYVLEGYPNTAMQARAMLAAGLLPSRVLVLQLEDEEVKRRLDGRRVDNTNNKVYHLQDAPPPAGADVVHREDDMPEQVELRLATYRQTAAAVLPHFRKVLNELDGSLKKDVLYRVVDPLVTPEMPSRAPRGCARVVLLGGPGSRSEEVGCTPAAPLPHPTAPLLQLAASLLHPCCTPLSCATPPLAAPLLAAPS